jgi:chromosome partitioning protein
VPVKLDHYSVLGATSLLSVISNMQEAYNHQDIKNLGFVYTNILQPPSAKTRAMKTLFETSSPFNTLFYFKNQLSFAQDLMVGKKGNIAFSYRYQENTYMHLYGIYLKRRWFKGHLK